MKYLHKNVIHFVLFLTLVISTITLSGCGCSHTDLAILNDTATCESDGTITYKCNQCNKEIKKASTKKNHDYSIIVGNNSTCEKSGDVTYKCSRCDSKQTITKKATGHSGIINCENCNQKFYNLLFDNLKATTLQDTSSAVHSTASVKYSRGNGKTIITWSHNFDDPISYKSTIVYTVKIDGSWSYSITGSNSYGSGTLSGELPVNKLYLYTKKNTANYAIELPLSSSNNGSISSLLYSDLKDMFCTTLHLFNEACTVNGQITMKNLGFVNF